MIKIENVEVCGWKPALTSMRNPMNSWEKNDSRICCEGGRIDCILEGRDCPYEDGKEGYVCIGPNDHDLAMRLVKAGTEHRKFLRMIVVYADITAPLYWWKEFDTYKVGTVANSCSTMHTLHKRDLTIEDFSCEYLTRRSLELFQKVIDAINEHRRVYVDYQPNRDFYVDHEEGPCHGQFVDNDVRWHNMIQLLPSSYNQRRTLMLNYEVLSNIYRQRLDHKLDEWLVFCEWIEQLPYSELITGREPE